jgi:hypothetical protein
MKLIILCLDAANKPSPIYVGVAEIWIDNQPCKGINLTTRHTHDMTKKPGRALPRPSAVFHVYASVNTPWVAQTLSHCTPMKQGKVWPTHWHTKLLSLGIPYVSYASVYFKCLFTRTQLTRALIDTGRGYQFGVLNLWSRPLSTWPSSILHFPLIAPPSLQLCQPFDYFAKPHRTSIDRKGPITSEFQSLVFYRKPTPLSIAYYRYISFIVVNKMV